MAVFAYISPCFTTISYPKSCANNQTFFYFTSQLFSKDYKNRSRTLCLFSIHLSHLSGAFQITSAHEPWFIQILPHCDISFSYLWQFPLMAICCLSIFKTVNYAVVGRATFELAKPHSGSTQTSVSTLICGNFNPTKIWSVTHPDSADTCSSWSKSQREMKNPIK